MRRRIAPSIVGGMAAAFILAAFVGCPGEKPGGEEGVAEKNDAQPKQDEKDPGATEVAAGGLAQLKLELPKPAFIGTPKNVPPGVRMKKPTGKPRPPFMAPAGVKNVALEKMVSASDEEPIIGEIDMITDGDKEAKDGSYVELGPGLQWVQIDLEEEYEIFVVLFWYYHGDPRIYHDVVVQVAEDPDFITGVKTIFNNDHDNSAGLGIGKEYEYFELFEGNLVDAGGVKSRYIRLYSNGSTADDMNRFTEVEVYGRPAK